MHYEYRLQYRKMLFPDLGDEPFSKPVLVECKDITRCLPKDPRDLKEMEWVIIKDLFDRLKQEVRT